MALTLKELISAQQKLAGEEARKQAAGQERMSIDDFKKMLGTQEEDSKKQVELLTNIETLSIQNNDAQKDQVETQKTLVEKDDGTHTRLDSMKSTLEKTLVETKSQSKTLEKIGKTEKVKPSVEQSIEAERDRQESVKLLKKIADNFDGKGKSKGEEKRKVETGFGLGGIASAIAVALGAIVGAISGYVKAIVKMNKMLFSAIESAMIGLGKFFPSIKKLLFNVEANFVLGIEMIKEAFGNFVQKAVKVFDGVVDFVKGILAKVLNSNIMKSVVEVFTKVVNGVKNFFAPVSDAFKAIEETSKPISKAIGFITTNLDTFSSFFSTIGSKLGMFAKLFKGVAVIAEKLALPLTVIMAIWDTVKGAIEGFEKEGIVGAISGAIKGLIGSLITGPLDLIKDLASWVLNAFGFDKASKFLDSFNFDEIMKQFIDAVFHPVDAIKKMFEGILNVLAAIEIPEIGFTIPVINKKVSIGPFRPFQKEGASTATSSGGATAVPSSAAKVQDQATAAAPGPVTGRAPTAGQIATATQSAPAPVEANAVYNKSADNASAAITNNSNAPVIVNAPTSINNSKSSQNIAMPAPIRNTDSGFGNYLRRAEVFV